MAEYTGEVIQDAAGAKPYTGEVIPLAKPAAPASAAPDKPLEQSTMDFISGNLNKGIAGLAGLPVDTARNVANLGIAAYGAGTGRGGAAPEPLQGGVGSSQWFEDLLRRGNMINQSAEPRTGMQRYGAAALQMAPSAALGRPGQIPNVPQAIKTVGTAAGAGLAGQAGADIGGEAWRGPASMLPGARSMQQKPPGERATAARQAQAFGQAKEAGIPVPPAAMRPDKPQQKIQNIANKDLRQPEGTELSPENLKRYTAQMYAEGYEPLAKGMKALTPNKTFQDTIKQMYAEQAPPPGALPRTFKGNTEVLKLLGDYQQGTTMEPKVALRAIKKLREDASTNFGSEKPEKVSLAKTQKGIANALEQLIDDNLQASGNQKLLGNYRQARTMIAKAHDYMDSLAPGNKVSGAALAQSAVQGKPLSGGARTIADISGQFPGAVQPPKGQEEMFTKKVSPMAMSHPPAIAAHQIGRLWDPMTLSRPYQAMRVDPRNRLSPEQERALRYLMAAQQSNQQGGIPTPPR